MEELPTANRVHVSLDLFDIAEDLSLRLFLNTLSRAEALVIAELFYLPQNFAIEKLTSRLEGEAQKQASLVLDKLKERGLIQFDGKTVVFGKEAKKQLEPYMERFEEDFEIEFSFLFTNLKQLPPEIVPGWFAINRILTSFQDAIIDKYLETPLQFQRFTQELVFDDPHAKDLLNLLFKKENFELSIDEMIHHFSSSTRDVIERSILCLEFALVAGWLPASDTHPSRISLVKEAKDLYLNLQKRLPKPAESLPTQISVNLEERLIQLIKLLSTQCLERAALSLPGTVSDWISIYRNCQETITSDLDLLIELGFVKEASPLVVTKYGFDWVAKSSMARKMDLYLRHRPASNFSPLSDRALKQIERSIFEKQPGVWLEKLELAKSLLWTSGEEGGIKLISKGRKWYYQLPVHSEQTLKLLTQVIDWLCEIGYLQESKATSSVAGLSSDLVLIPQEARSLFIH